MKHSVVHSFHLSASCWIPSISHPSWYLDSVGPLFRVVVRSKSSVDISLQGCTWISIRGRPTGPALRGSGASIGDDLLCEQLTGLRKCVGCGRVYDFADKNTVHINSCMYPQQWNRVQSRLSWDSPSFRLILTLGLCFFRRGKKAKDVIPSCFLLG